MAAETPEGQGAAAATGDAVLIPAGSILRAVFLSGMDAPTGRAARRDPYPALARIKHDAILPNRFRADMRECFLILAGYGDLASERAYLRSESIACVREEGGAIEVAVDGYAVGEDGKAGVRGRLVNKQGQIIAKSMEVAFLEGFSKLFSTVRVLPARLHEVPCAGRYRGSPVPGFPEAPRWRSHSPQLLLSRSWGKPPLL